MVFSIGFFYDTKSFLNGRNIIRNRRNLKSVINQKQINFAIYFRYWKNIKHTINLCKIKKM